jgi:hypothetical protein
LPDGFFTGHRGRVLSGGGRQHSIRIPTNRPGRLSAKITEAFGDPARPIAPLAHGAVAVILGAFRKNSRVLEDYV